MPPRYPSVRIRPQLFWRPDPTAILTNGQGLTGAIHPEPACETMSCRVAGQDGDHEVDALSQEHGREFGRAVARRRNLDEECAGEPRIVGLDLVRGHPLIHVK